MPQTKVSNNLIWCNSSKCSQVNNPSKTCSSKCNQDNNPSKTFSSQICNSQICNNKICNNQMCSNKTFSSNFMIQTSQINSKTKFRSIAIKSVTIKMLGKVRRSLRLKKIHIHLLKMNLVSNQSIIKRMYLRNILRGSNLSVLRRRLRWLIFMIGQLMKLRNQRKLREEVHQVQIRWTLISRSLWCMDSLVAMLMDNLYHIVLIKFVKWSGVLRMTMMQILCVIHVLMTSQMKRRMTI